MVDRWPSWLYLVLHLELTMIKYTTYDGGRIWSNKTPTFSQVIAPLPLCPKMDTMDGLQLPYRAADCTIRSLSLSYRKCEVSACIYRDSLQE